MIGRAGAAIKECGAVELACLISLTVYMDSLYCCNSFMSKCAQNMF